MNTHDSFRYVIVLLALLGLTFVFGNPLIFNFTVICMERVGDNGTVEAAFSPTQTSWLFSVVALGNLLSTFLVTQLIVHIGGRATFALYGVVSGIATLLVPLCVQWGFWPMVVARMLQGAGAGITFAALGTVVGTWSTLSATGFTVSVVSSYIQCGPMYTSYVASAFCASGLGWPATYYLQGFLTLVVFVLLWLVYRDSPKLHPLVTEAECEAIEADKGADPEHPGPVPYGRIFTDHSVWGVLYTAFGNLLGQQIFLIYGAVYLNQVLHLSVESTGLAALIANAACILLKLAVSPLSDYGSCVTQKMRAKLITTVSHVLMTAAFVVLALIDDRHPVLGMTAYATTIVVSSLQSVGFIKTAQLSCRQFSYVVLSVVACINCCIVLFLPLFVALVAPTNAPAEWQLAFWIIAVIIALTVVVYDCTAQADPRPWALQDKEPNEMQLHRGSIVPSLRRLSASK